MGIDGEITLRKATWNDREQILNLAARIFYKETGEWLAERSWFRYAPDKFDASNYWVATSGNELIGLVAFRKFTLRMPSVNLPWIGVGSVCTKPEWRGKGVMQSLLQKGIEETDRQGVPISILWGDRLRYGWFGWERAGSQIEFALNTRYFPDPGWNETKITKCVGEGRQTVFSSGLGDRLFSIQKLYGHHAPRPIEEQLGLISRPGYETYITDQSENSGNVKSAYIVMQRQPKGVSRLCEAVGPPEMVVDLIGYVLRDTSESLQVSVPSFDLTEAERVLLSRANTMSVVPTAMVRVHDLPALLKHYEPWWDKRRRVGSGQVVLVMVDENGMEEQSVGIEWTPSKVKVVPLQTEQRLVSSVTVSVHRRELASLLFGPLPIEVIMPSAPEAWILKEIFPLPLYVPYLERV